MKQNTASRTAEYMALFRAIESYRPAKHRLFNDPYAFNFLHPSLKAVAFLSRIPVVGGLIPNLIDRRWAGARTSGVARTRLIDDLLARALTQGIEQVVILGAGFDARAYRIADLERVKIFEVDHPDTQAAKQTKLLQSLGALPAHIKFAGCDFNRQSLEETLLRSGFTMAARSFFIWEGVTNYLTEEAVDQTLRFIGKTAPESQLLFTYIHRGVLDGSFSYKSEKNLNRTLKGLREKWTFGWEPSQLAEYLMRRNLRLLEDIGSVEYRGQYLEKSEANLTGYEFYRAALAEVTR